MIDLPGPGEQQIRQTIDVLPRGRRDGVGSRQRRQISLGPAADRAGHVQPARQFVAGGTVRLQMDRERQDKYGRYLAYVWVGQRMLNEELIRFGLATAETGFRYSSSMKTRFRRAEAEAKDAGRGIWSSAPARPGNL